MNVVLKDIVGAISSFFFGWMPLSLRIVFGAFLALCFIVMLIKVISLILNAIPFL